MTATSDSGPDPLAALPLLTEAGVSVYWQTLEGRTAWTADANTREVRLSRAIPRESLLRYLIQALQVLDEEPGPGPAPARTRHLRLVHSTDDVERPPDRAP